MFHWPLNDIDETDIESLIPFVFEFPKWKGRSPADRPRQLYADDVDWL